MAEMMLGAAFQAEGLGSDVTVDSAGTTGYEAGRPIDPRAMNKVRMLRSFDRAAAGSDLLEQGIEDPWYGGHADFDAVWEQIRGAVPGVVAHVRTVVGQAAPRQQLMQQQVRSIS